ncbi:MAG: hypothetical protein U0939_02725 [Pirellulales bacterium]
MATSISSSAAARSLASPPNWSDDEQWYDPEPPGRLRSVSWLVSAVVHAVAFLLFALVGNPPPPAGNSTPERRAGIVLVDLSTESPQYFEPGADDAVGGESSAVAASAANPSDSAASADGQAGAVAGLPGASAAPLDATAALPTSSALSAGDAVGDGLGGGGTLLGGGAVGTSAPRGLGKPAQTAVFGLPGTGRKFVYLFDRSASMSGFEGRPMRAAKRELAKSLRTLESTHQFQIIFYNHGLSVFNPKHPLPPKMVFGEARNKELAERYIASVVPDGGTDHMQALRLALGMGPDVLFFLTDADDPQLTEAELGKVHRLNRGSTINTIEFGAGPRRSSNNFLVRLAHQNGGQHLYVDVTQLAP